MASKKVERERRFLVKEIPQNIDQYPKAEIIQGYLMITPEREIRLREEDGSVYFFELKDGSGEERLEPGTLVSKKFFDEFWSHRILKKEVIKTRYYIPSGRSIIALNVFHGEAEGYKNAEVEFKTKKESRAFVAPDWFGEEVTNDPRHNSKNILLYGAPAETNGGVVLALKTRQGIKKAVSEIKTLVRAQNRSVFVLIGAGSSAGKGEIVKALEAILGEDFTYISGDDYYYGLPFMEQEWKRGNNITWDDPEAVESSLLVRHTEDLIKGRPIRKQTYSFKTGLRSKKLETVWPKKIIAVEWNFSLFDPALFAMADYCIFVDVGLHGRMIRRIIRDVRLNRTNWKPIDVLGYFQEVVQSKHEKYIEPSKKRANIIIPNEYDPNVEASKTGVSGVQVKFEGLVSRETLDRVGARPIASIEQDDHYYNPHDRDLRKTREVLRVREEGENLMLTYKGPKHKSEDFLVRDEIPPIKINRKIADWFFTKYGREITEITKRREIFLLDGIIIARDHEVTRYEKERGRILELGDFTEISGNEIAGKREREKMAQVIEKLGLNPKKAIVESYIEM
jgi:predicted adenylyl cyclase CyaB